MRLNLDRSRDAGGHATPSYHLVLIRTGNLSLSDTMRVIEARYATYFDTRQWAPGATGT